MLQLRRNIHCLLGHCAPAACWGGVSLLWDFLQQMHVCMWWEIGFFYGKNVELWMSSFVLVNDSEKKDSSPVFKFTTVFKLCWPSRTLLWVLCITSQCFVACSLRELYSCQVYSAFDILFVCLFWQVLWQRYYRRSWWYIPILTRPH